MMQEHVGAIGTGVTAGTGIVAWATQAIPVFEVVSLFISCIVGVLTAAWYIRKFIKAR